MNILFNCSEYPPTRNGGIGSVTKIVAEELASRGHHVYVVGNYPELSKRIQEDVINGVTVIRYNVSFIKGYLRNIYPYLNKLYIIKPLIQWELNSYEREINRIIKERNIDVLELTDYYGFNRYNCKLRYSCFSVPVVLRVHGSITFMKDIEGKDTKYSLVNDNRHFQRAQYLSSVSLFSQKYVERRFNTTYFKEKKVIYNPIEDRFINYNMPSSSKVIIYVGRLTENKGAYSTIKAFNKLVEQFPDWELRMLGIGDQDAAARLLTEVSKTRVKFLGFCTRDVLEREIVNASFACVPSYFENFSMVPLEIMAKARCIIYTNKTSGAEIVEDGEDGYAVAPDDIDAIAKCMTTLVSGQEIRNTFAEKAYHKIKERFSASIIVSEMEDFYKSVI